MRRRTKALLILTLVLALLGGSVLYVIIIPGKWTSEIVQYVNESLLFRNGWELSVSDLDGQLSSDLNLNNIYLKKKDGSIILFCERSVLNLDFTQIISGNWALSNLLMDNLLVTLNQEGDEYDFSVDFIKELAQSSLRVKSFSINQSSIRIQKELIDKLYSFDAFGKIKSNNETLDVIFSSSKFHDFQSGLDLQINRGKLIFDGYNASAEEIIGTLNGYHVRIDGTGELKDNKNLSLDIAINQVLLEDFQIGSIPEIINKSIVNMQMNFRSDSSSNYFKGSLIDAETSELISELESKYNINDNGLQFSDALINIGLAKAIIIF